MNEWFNFLDAAWNPFWKREPRQKKISRRHLERQGGGHARSKLRRPVRTINFTRKIAKTN